MTSLRGLSGAFEVLHLAHDILRLSGLCLTLHLHLCADLGKPSRGNLSTFGGFGPRKTRFVYARDHVTFFRSGPE